MSFVSWMLGFIDLITVSDMQHERMWRAPTPLDDAVG